VLDEKHQTDKHMKKLRDKIKGKDKKALQKAEKDAKAAAKAAEAARKNTEKADAEAAKKAEKDAANHQATKASIAAEKEASKKAPKAECYGAWMAKGDKAEVNKLRFKPELDSMEVGKILGGQKVNVIGEATVKKADGSEVRRLNINIPKAGWVTAANFEQAGQKQRDEDEAKANEAAAGSL
jgi:hypothetical protein